MVLALIMAVGACLVTSAVVAEGPLVSPEVHPDRTVTFRILSPGATKVVVNLDGHADIPMLKDGKGVWSATTEPLAPDWYGYSIAVDDVSMRDPSNPIITPNLVWFGSQVLVPGDPAELWEVCSVPHGVLHAHPYHSKVIGDDREFIVYTPPGYDPRSHHHYPVLYLFHGFSDNARGWTDVGRANWIFDNLIAAKRMVPAVVVMPLGYGVSDFVKLRERAFDAIEIRDRNFAVFEQALLAEVIPQVESEYRISKDRKDHAVAGLSMGGSETLLVGLHNLDRFAYIGAFSSGGLQSTFPAYFAGVKDNGLKGFTIACGVDDRLITWNRNFAKWIQEQGFKPKVVEVPGGHQWQLWRRFLGDFCQTLFKD